MCYRIPLSALPDQEFNITLNKQNCTINIYQRGDYMYLDLFVANHTVQRGALMLPKTSLITVSNNLFKGQLRILDKSSIDKPLLQAKPHFSELGSRFELYYFTPDEVNLLCTQASNLIT